MDYYLNKSNFGLFIYLQIIHIWINPKSVYKSDYTMQNKENSILAILRGEFLAPTLHVAIFCFVVFSAGDSPTQEVLLVFCSLMFLIHHTANALAEFIEYLFFKKETKDDF